ncbi:MAG: hypothetical protein HFI33_11415 [Lachnospiraceae bacterium]|nr:hypothetical protein [Lachnospiraceae bacterium]
MKYAGIILALTACTLLLGGCGQEEERPKRAQRIEEVEQEEEKHQKPNVKDSSETVEKDTAREEDTWRSVYAAYLEMMGGGDSSGYFEDVTFSLIYVNNDDVPELVCNSGVEAGGCQILTYQNGKIDTLQTSRLYFDYLEKGNLLCNSDGKMGYYYDVVYRIQDGKWQFVAEGDYHDPDGGPVQDEEGNFIYQYTWEGKEVSEEEYQRGLATVYDKEKAQTPAVYYDMGEILSVLQTGHHSSALHFYELVVEDLTWREAQTACEARGGYLATITSAEEREAIEAQIEEEGKTGISFFVGANNGQIDQEPFGYSWIEPGKGRRAMPYLVYNGFWAEDNGNYLEPSYHGVTEDGREVEEDYVVLMYSRVDKRYYMYDVPDDILDAAPSYKGNIGYICEYDK